MYYIASKMSQPASLSEMSMNIGNEARAHGSQREPAAIPLRVDSISIEPQQKSSVGRNKCEHNRQRSLCKDCKGSSICEHDRQRSKCKDCKGGGICEHDRVRSRCKECKGGEICEHNR